MQELVLEMRTTASQTPRPTSVCPDHQRTADTRVRQGDTFDQQYLDLLSQGDPAAETHFSSHFGKLLTVKLKYRLRSKELVEDARQETFLRVLHVLRNKGGIKNPERLGAFVNAVSENVMLEIFRSGRLDQRRVTYENDFAATVTSMESVMITAQRKEFLRARLNELPESDQRMLREVFVEERDKDEICAELGISRNNLRVRLHRILQRYRKVISACSR